MCFFFVKQIKAANEVLKSPPSRGRPQKATTYSNDNSKINKSSQKVVAKQVGQVPKSSSCHFNCSVRAV